MTAATIWNWGGRVGVGVAVVVGTIIAVLWYVPEWQGTRVPDDVSSADTLRLVNEYRRTLAQIIGGLALLFGLYLTWRRIAATETSVEIANESQVTERFTRAIDQLGSEQIAIRLGGIYALERIARDSQKDHWTVVEVLTAFVRERSGPLRDELEKLKLREQQGKDLADEGPPTAPTDIQAALTVLGRRTWLESEGSSLLDLSNSYLRRANLGGANLRRANLIKADLSEANLGGANLRRANLGRANLIKANLIKANLRRANLGRANLIKANLHEANLSRAFLIEANLHEAYLVGADLRGAYLHVADLRGANLERVTNLAQEQIAKAQIDSDTLLPDDLRAAMPTKEEEDDGSPR